jgi:hypothetical protein
MIINTQNRTADNLTTLMAYGYFIMFVLYQLAMRILIVGIIVMLLVSSFWVPQIVHNVRCNTRKGFQK